MPDPSAQHTRPHLSDEEAAEEARKIIADFATSYRDNSPLPRYGPTPPVDQPGIPSMSPQATDIGRAAMFCGLATVPPGLIAIGILVASQHADPTVIGMICAAPAAIAVPILAIARLIRRAGEAAPPEHHHHYNGPVHQQTIHTHTTNSPRWWGKSTTNNH